MTLLPKILAAFAINLLVGIDGYAMAEEAPWWETLVCPEIAQKAPGGSPETARHVELQALFEELDDLVDNHRTYKHGELPPPLPKETLAPNCHWVEFEGYFRPIQYHSFKGQMLIDATDHYFPASPIGFPFPHFWVENWKDQGTVSHSLHNRRIRIRARVYDQCLAEGQYDLQRKEPGFRFGGACHYGENTGMILTDAEVVDVLSPDKVISQMPDLSDVLEHPVKTGKFRRPPRYVARFESLRPVKGLPSEASHVVREWIRRAQSGPEQMIREDGALGTSGDTARTSRIRKIFKHPDGRYGYLNAQPGFSSVDPDNVQIKFLATRPFSDQRNSPRVWHGFGCIALSPTVNWPVAEIDAEYSVATFACVKISLWQGPSGNEWRSHF